VNITNRTTHPVQQGTGPWLRLREGYKTASEAPAAAGVGKYVTRAELLRQKHTGVAAEHSAATLGKFAAGHAAEDGARPLAEVEAGGELFPVTMTVEVDGLHLLASLDGLTMDDEIAWETKLWNEELAAAVRSGPDALPAHYTVQMDQELLVSGASRCLFSCTDGTPERFVSCWYESSPEKFAALIDTWRQFDRDLAAYVLPEAKPEPARAEPLEFLPAVSVRLDGALSVVGNLPSFAVALREFVAKIPAKPSTDTEFATTEAACKALKKAEDALDAAEAGALASITDVDAMRRAVADCRKLARDTRLAAEKMVDRRKLEIKEQAVLTARRVLDDHIADLNGEIAPMRLQPVVADFAGAIKGLRSFDSMQGALDAVLASAKIAADRQARDIRANVAVFKAATGDDALLQALFVDLGTIVHKAADDFALVVKSRITAYHEAEAAKEARRKAEEAAAATPAPAPAPAPVAPAPVTLNQVLQTVAPAPISAALAPAPRADEPATLKLGVIGERLGFTVSAAFLSEVLHIAPAGRAGSSVLYRESQFPLICRQLQSHISAMAELYAAEEVA